MAGRKRSFDRDIALDKAMRIFWNNGYAATSVANLTSELGINTPSLYAAFGNKEQLFKEVVAHYIKQYSEPCYRHITEPSDAHFIERLRACFYELIQKFSDADTPLGCLLVKSVNEYDSVAFPEEATVYIKQFGLKTKNLLTTLIESEGVITETATAELQAKYLLSVVYGLSTQVRAGESQQVAESVMDYAINTIPTCSGQ
ncbi:putative TetR family transcriptional regulator [Vibrio halioticoli NBRC 102217]|uniref:Putative TetR family transcriptional regulator n=1 Tax=Vibrio halioticoli NBRC 102217 TaxID=1219072 RepID=V5FDF2_9VIBR|nr:TetR/AcrR family transcriptional regulator [Vibrio halioticoli]GAD89633.1 putative TetR family transcriptional regulator [Vibrio halioticoli NBRC 102217]